MRQRVFSILAAMVVGIVGAVTLMIEAEPARAAFPGANGKIVFVEENRDESDYGIKLVNSTGSGVTTLVKNPRGAAELSDPAMSPNGRSVVYAKNRDIYRIDISNRKVTRITNNRSGNEDPAWSPDGSRIVFESTRAVGGARDTDLFVKRSTGAGRTINLTKSAGEDEFSPAWSPNGREIAFHSGTSRDVAVLTLATGQRRNITNDGAAANDRYPNWSPNGSRIAFESFAPGVPPDYADYDRIFTANASDGSDRRLLAQEYYDDSFGEGAYFSGPAYSPNGKQIAYVRTAIDYVNARPQIYRMSAATGTNKKLVYNAYNSGSGYPYGEDVSVRSLDWGDLVRR